MSEISIQEAEKRFAAAELKLQQAANRLRSLNARKSAKQAAQDRKDRTRMLILTGAAMWEKAKRNEEFKALLLRWLDEELVDARNRELFALDEKPEHANKGNVVPFPSPKAGE